MKLTRSVILFYAQLLVITTLPFHLLASSYAIIILLLVFLYSLFKSASFRKEIWSSFLSNRVAQILVLLFVAYAFSTILHPIFDSDKTFRFSAIEKRLSFFIFPFLFANIKSYDNKQIQKFFYIYIIVIVSSTLIALSAGLYYTFSSGSIYFYDSENLVVFNNFMYHRLGSYIGIHAVYYAEYVLLAFIMWVSFSYYHFLNWSIKRRSLAILLGAYFVGVMFLLKSAAILIILLAIISLFTTYYLYKAKDRISIPMKLIIVVIGVFFVMILAERAITKIGSKADFFTYDLSQPGGGEWNGFNLRLAKWHVAKLAIKDNWLIGVGPGNTTPTLDTYYEKIGFTYALQLHYNPHNQFLQTFLALGIVGVLILIMVFLASIRHSLNKKDSVMFLFIMSFLLFSMSESTLAVNKGIVFFSIFLCFFSYLPKKSSDYLNASKYNS
jgi:O-antigen ligase